MDIAKTEREGVVVFSLHGRLDAYTAPSVRDILFTTIEGGQSKLVIDLTEATFVDSNGLATLVAGMKRARQCNGDLRLVGLQPSVKIIFELTRLDRAFEILPDTNSATMSFY